MIQEEQQTNDTPIGLDISDMEDIWEKFEAFKGSKSKSPEMTEKERQEELRKWDEDYELWLLQKHQLEEDYEYL